MGRRLFCPTHVGQPHFLPGACWLHWWVLVVGAKGRKAKPSHPLGKPNVFFIPGDSEGTEQSENQLISGILWEEEWCKHQILNNLTVDGRAGGGVRCRWEHLAIQGHIQPPGSQQPLLGLDFCVFVSAWDVLGQVTLTNTAAKSHGVSLWGTLRVTGHHPAEPQ